MNDPHTLTDVQQAFEQWEETTLQQSLARFPHPALARLLRLARSGRRGN